jgi:TRAP-type mannitol/chloroaromatic compound transport system permease large subunit
VFLGNFNTALLGLLSSRLLGLLENDLLQAIPLYVLFGILLQTSGLSQDVLDLFKRLCLKLHLPQQMSVLLFSALAAPMNGSVAANANMLKRLLTDKAVNPQNDSSLGLVCAASTVGLVIPPSLVLILMGDVMMRAHTQAFNSGLLMSTDQHVMNTADMFNAALAPAVLVFVLWLLVTVGLFRNQNNKTIDSLLNNISIASRLRAWLTVIFICLMLGSVFHGTMYAVEAAASGCLVLFLYVLCRFPAERLQWTAMLDDVFSFSGSLLTLLIAATTFSLVFRLFETDQWISQWIVESPADHFHVALILVGVAACAWLMDAFELIFVVIPVVSPGLIILLGSAEQTAVLLLLVIQLSYLVPPFGYAVVIARQSLSSNSQRRLIKHLLPYWLVLLLVFCLVFFKPQWIRW